MARQARAVFTGRRYEKEGQANVPMQLDFERLPADDTSWSPGALHVMHGSLPLPDM